VVSPVRFRPSPPPFAAHHDHRFPGRSAKRVRRRHGDGGKARVAAPAERRRANEALVDLLTRALALPRDRIRIVSGHASRRKLVEITDLDAEEVRRRLEAAAPSSP
jgi:uncharacterized protein